MIVHTLDKWMFDIYNISKFQNVHIKQSQQEKPELKLIPAKINRNDIPAISNKICYCKRKFVVWSQWYDHR